MNGSGVRFANPFAREARSCRSTSARRRQSRGRCRPAALRRPDDIITSEFESNELPAEFAEASRIARMNGADEFAEGDGCVRTDRRPVIWFEVEDFLRYFDHFRNPTGLQRVP